MFKGVIPFVHRKNKKMEEKFFIGIDVSKEKFDVCVLWQGQKICSEVFENIPKGVKQLLKHLKQLDNFELSDAVFCMEQTGYYCNHLLESLHEQGAVIWLESAVKIKQVNKFNRAKSDRIDAQMIALYASKNQEDLKKWEPKREAVRQLKYLFALRSRLVKQKSQLLVPLNEAKEYVSKDLQKIEMRLMKDAIKGIEKALEKTEKEIDVLIGRDENICHQFKLLTSIDSIGRVTAIYMIIATNEFKDFKCPKKFACYSGVAPFEHTSGSSLRGRTRVSHYANKTIKSLLHLAALSSVGHSREMREFYLRKVSEGKNKMSVINAVRNKLVLRMFAVIRDNRMYEKGQKIELVKS